MLTTEAEEAVIIPVKMSFKSFSNRVSKKLTADWKKVSGLGSYEVPVADMKNFKSGKK